MAVHLLGPNKPMNNERNYYECQPDRANTNETERFPANHVRYSWLLRPLNWIESSMKPGNFRPFLLKNVMLAEFDRAAPLDSVLGSAQELAQTRRLVELAGAGFDQNPFLSPAGRLLLKLFTMGLMRNRRRVLEHYHQHRDYVERRGKIIAPLIITGLPRSGTTLLQRLISEDPQTRSPYTFELEAPLPPMANQADPLNDPRIRTSASSLKMLKRLAPGFVEKLNQSHYWSATEMEESLIYMLAHSGIPMMNAATAGHSFIDQFLTIDDKRTVFRYERLFFSILEAYRPCVSHWTFKAPNYAPCFPLIFDTYPDARVVLTHRNPLVTLPSYCRLMESWCLPFDQDGAFDKHSFGQISKRFIDLSLKAPLAYRKENQDKESQIFDCMYSELFADPIGTVKNVYKKFNLSYTNEFEQRMIAYLQKNRQGKYGRHQYSLAEYGFQSELVYDSYREYMEFYGFQIPVETQRPSSLGAVLSIG